MATNSDERLGSYLLGPKIGKGAAGVVYKATSAIHPEPVAVKILREDLSGDDKTVARFLREKRIFSAVDHPNVVKVHNLVAENDRLGIVMELIEGGDLRGLIASGELTPSDSIALARQVAEGLTHIHEVGVLHRDLKPANVLVSGPVGERVAKIADFGVSRLVDDAMTRTSSTIGTPLYMAPEVTDSRGAESPADVYALGAILFEMLVGAPPFHGDGALAVILAHARHPVPQLTDVPTELSQLVSSMLTKRPGGRPTAAEVVSQLTALTPLIDDEMTPTVSTPLGPGVADEPPFASPLATSVEPDTVGPELASVATVASTARAADFINRHRGAAAAVVLAVALMATMAVSMVRDTAVAASEQARTIFAPELREDVLLVTREWTLESDGILQSTTDITNLGRETVDADHLETLPPGSFVGEDDRVEFTVAPVEVDGPRSTARFALTAIEPDETVTIGYRLRLDDEQRGESLAELAVRARRTELSVLTARNISSTEVQFSALRIEPAEMELTVGQDPRSVVLFGQPVDASDQWLELDPRTAQWRTVNEAVATVDEDGLVSPVADGLTTLEARSQGLATSAAILVRASNNEVAAGPVAEDGDETLPDSSTVRIDTAGPETSTELGRSAATGAATSRPTTRPTTTRLATAEAERPATTSATSRTTIDTPGAGAPIAPTSPTTSRATTSTTRATTEPSSLVTEATTSTTRATTSTTRATTTTTRPTTTTTRPTTTTTTRPTTTEAAGVQVAIVSGPRVVSVGPTSAVFSYTTNNVCGTGSFTYRNKATGAFVGQWIGDDACFGPVHEGRTAWGGIVLEPGTTYSVSITLDGKPSDGSKPTGVGRATSSIEITTPG